MLKNGKEGEAVLHFFCLYENQFGALFDTYYWLKLKVAGGNVLVAKDFKNRIHFLFPPNELKNMGEMGVKSKHCTYWASLC